MKFVFPQYLRAALQICSLQLLAILLIAHPNASAQTFVGGSGPIHDLSTNDIPLTVTGLSPANIDTINFGLQSVCINLDHTYDADLDIRLVAPDGTSALLVANAGGGGHNFTNTCFTDTAALAINAGSAPFTGFWKPQGEMGIVNNLQNGNGTWILRVTDQAGADTGFVYNWSITFGNDPATYYSFSGTDLPLVVINTFGQGIPNDPKITARMGIVDNGPGNPNHATDPFNAYNNYIGIETRGNSSQGFAQKQYSMETRTVWGDNLDTTLLGMPAHHDWILYGPYSDKSLMRNHLTFQLSRDMGRWAVRRRYCEMVLDGQYMGVYELSESIKRDANRVDIAKMTTNDIYGDALTGGYMAKIDWIGGPYFASQHLPDQTNPYNNVIRFQIIYPEPANIVPTQANYFQAYMDSFETALFGPTFEDTVAGWRHYADEASFIDHFLITELAKNIDGYWLSTYFYKDKNSKGGKLTMGPFWDFNGGWHGADYCNAPAVDNWQYNEPSFCAVDMPMWWKRLLQDTLYTNRVQCRWTELRSTVLDTAHIFHIMDSVSTLLSNAQVRHFSQWPILGIYTWPNPAPLAQSFQEEVQNTKAWIRSRLLWVDANLPGTCYPPVVANDAVNALAIKVYPNPSQGRFKVSSAAPIDQLTVTDMLGKVVLEARPNENLTVVQLNNPGIYLVHILSGEMQKTEKVTVLR